jgi:hypothetical protein
LKAVSDIITYYKINYLVVGGFVLFVNEGCAKDIVLNKVIKERENYH